MIKHDFKIQQITVRNRLGFMKKLVLALVKSVYAQYLTQTVKKTDVYLERKVFNWSSISRGLSREFGDRFIKHFDDDTILVI